MNLLIVIFVLFGSINSSAIQQPEKQLQIDNEYEFGKRLNNRPSISLSSHYRRNNRAQRITSQHHEQSQNNEDYYNSNQNNYHKKSLNNDLFVSETNNNNNNANNYDLNHQNANNKMLKKIFIKGKIRRSPLFVNNNSYNVSNNTSGYSMNLFHENLNLTDNTNIDNKEMDHHSNVTKIDTNSQIFTDKSDDNENGESKDDQTTAESLYSNHYVAVGGAAAAAAAVANANPLNTFKQNIIIDNNQIHPQQQDEEKTIRQPLLVDNLLAMSNELPPLTAALPMHYLHNDGNNDLISHTHPYHGDSTLPLSDLNDHSNIASLYSPPISTETKALTNDLLLDKRPIVIAHHSTTHPYPLTGLNPATTSAVNHLYDPITTTSGLLDVTNHNPLHDSLHNNNNGYNEHGLFANSYVHSIPGIPGRPWIDYPLYSHVPKTTFTCNGAYGFFADIETSCQVWHYCQPDGRLDSFLCTNGTIFSQSLRTCDWWYNVDCKSSPKHYGVNADLYKQSYIDNSHLNHHHNHHHSISLHEPSSSSSLLPDYLSTPTIVSKK